MTAATVVEPVVSDAAGTASTASTDLTIRLVSIADVTGFADGHARVARLGGFGGEPGEACVLEPSIAVVGIGAAHPPTAETLRLAAVRAGELAARAGNVRVELPAGLIDSPHRPDVVATVTAGLAGASYRYRSARQPETPITLAGTGPADDQAIRRGLCQARAVATVRDLVNDPPNALTPARFASDAADIARANGLDVEVWDAADLKRERMGGVLCVGQGSVHPPAFVVVAYHPPGARQTVALVGKGITFDSGGLSLKSAEGLLSMKCDMAGAATVLAATVAAAQLGLPVGIRCYLPLAENMPGPAATRVGDVVETRSGLTVEVLNTDFEGRVLLSDALTLAAQAAPDVIVDIATLTESCVVALGPEIAGLFSNDDDLAARLRSAADKAGEPVWRLPLDDRYAGQVRSEIADLKNFPGSRYGRAVTAALFLQRFVPQGMAWAHLDVAGPAWSDRQGSLGATGFGTATLLRFVESLAEQPTGQPTGQPTQTLHLPASDAAAAVPDRRIDSNGD
jgi:leucyl aminopeptidase